VLWFVSHAAGFFKVSTPSVGEDDLQVFLSGFNSGFYPIECIAKNHIGIALAWRRRTSAALDSHLVPAQSVYITDLHGE
jgi:hypothetical protein